MLVSCSSAGSGAVKKITKGKELAFYNFSEPKTFEEGLYGGAQGGVRLEVTEGVYRISLTEGDGELWWGQWGDQYQDTVIDVDAFQRTQRGDNAFGIMCRVRGTVGNKVAVESDVSQLATQVKESSFTATPGPETTDTATVAPTSTPTQEATAEATRETSKATSEATSETTAEARATNTATTTPTATATITDTPTPTATSTSENTPEATPEVTETAVPVNEGDGYLFLIQGDGFFAIMRSQGRALTKLVDWQSSDAINRGVAKNHLRAVCAGDYLAFYINNQLVGEATDDTYQSGQVGLTASSADVLGVKIDFDNLQVSEAVSE